MTSQPDHRTDSPVGNSGRASPANVQLRSKDDDASSSKKDKVLRRWAVSVERVLSTFDHNVEEWADYISFLGRLLKALQGRPMNANEVPHKHSIAKRLSQCLGSGLPSGVHQKSLEVYAHIFSFLGRDGLSQDLALYLPGLAPVVSFASLSVKPLILSIYEDYVVELHPTAIRPALKSLILSLLPALEEENTDDFERVTQILTKLKLASRKSTISIQNPSGHHQYFWQCLFLASITSPSRRAGALAYLSRHLPVLVSASGEDNIPENNHPLQLLATEDAAAVSSPEPGLLIRCFCTGLQDSHVLVQRGFLDLLCEKVPLNSVVLQEKARKGDLEKLVMAATSVILRRDMSLNRRLWTWFLGIPAAQMGAANVATSPVVPEVEYHKTPTTVDGNTIQIEFCKKYAMTVLIHGLRNQLDSQTDATSITKALRICLALMDRWEIGSVIIPHIFADAILSVYRFYISDSSRALRNDVLRSGSMFFDSVESPIIWAQMIKLIQSSFQDTDQSLRATTCGVIVFVATKFNLQDEDMQTKHIPLAAAYVVLQIYREVTQTRPVEELQQVNLSQPLKAAISLLQQIPSGVMGLETNDAADPLAAGRNFDRTLFAIEDLYSNDLSVTNLISISRAAYRIALNTTCQILAAILAFDRHLSYETIESAILLFDEIVRKSPSAKPDFSTIISQMSNFEHNLILPHTRSTSLSAALSRVSILEVIKSSGQNEYLFKAGSLRGLVRRLVGALWDDLLPTRPQYHIEASKAIWRLHNVCGTDDLVESCIVDIGVKAFDSSHGDSSHGDSSAGLEHCQIFAIFWQQSQGQADLFRNRRAQMGKTHNSLSVGKLQLLSRPLFLILDQLLEVDDEIGVFVSHWLRQMSELPTVMNVVLAHIVHATTTFMVSNSSPSTPANVGTAVDDSDVDVPRCIYLVRLLTEVLMLGHTNLQLLIHKADTDDLRQQVLARLEMIADMCLRLQWSHRYISHVGQNSLTMLRQCCLKLLENTISLLPPESILQLKIDVTLLECLEDCITQQERQMQLVLTRITADALELRFNASNLLPQHNLHGTERDSEAISRQPEAEGQFIVPPKTLECLIQVFSHDKNSSVLDCWFSFLNRILPLYGTAVFQILMPLNECLCKALSSTLQDLIYMFSKDKAVIAESSESATIQILNSLERSLELAHGTFTESSNQPLGSDKEQQSASFFSMVSVLSSEANRGKSASENNRLTVLICLKDALKMCFDIWALDESSIGGRSEDTISTASFKSITLKLRNRTRRIAEHFFQASELESVETLVAQWHDYMVEGDQLGCSKVLGFISTIDAARPKITTPAIFNAIYSRTHPTALDPERRSSLTSSLSEVALTEFLITYTRSLEDDAMEEIWQNCITFLKDILTSPLNHRQILVQLLEFVVELGAKIDKTNFGDQRRMRRELGDLFIRLISAITTLRPAGTGSEKSYKEARSHLFIDSDTSYKDLITANSADLVSVLAAIFPRLPMTLLEHDRIGSVTSQVSTQILGPLLRSRGFPETVELPALDLLRSMGHIPEASKTFKKDVGDAFNDSRFFASGLSKAHDWLPILRQWSIGDKERLPDLYQRLAAPAAAGIMFGVGASGARIEADRKTQLTLRRIATLIVAAPQDAFVVNLPGLVDRLVDLLTATSASSPSSATRAELYMVLRSIFLQVSPSHLNMMWPIVNTEISDALSSIMRDSDRDLLTPESLLQLCKLIDTLLVLNYDGFQLQEWLLITDTTDAVYRPSEIETTALVDLLAEELSTGNITDSSFLSDPSATQGRRKPLLDHTLVKTIAKADYMDRLFRPFFRQLSIVSFEGTYNLEEADVDACIEELVADLFDEATLA